MLCMFVQTSNMPFVRSLSGSELLSESKILNQSSLAIQDRPNGLRAAVFLALSWPACRSDLVAVCVASIGQFEGRQRESDQASWEGL